jgi:hypothetical protein
MNIQKLVLIAIIIYDFIFTILMPPSSLPLPLSLPLSLSLPLPLKIKKNFTRTVEINN